MKRAPLKRDDLIFPELSYEIIGCAYEVFNEIGFGFKESVYQKAMAIALKEKNIPFREQVYHEVKFKNEILAKRFFDFIVEEKIIVELKRDDKFSKANIDQTIDYLKTSKLKLALLINFGRERVVYRRLINP